MPRPSQQLHPHREPVPTRLAATEQLHREAEGDGALQIQMTRRSPNASFAPGAYVFPGGGIDALDAQAHHVADRRPAQSDLHLTQAVAAIRPSLVSGGGLGAPHADGRMADAADIATLDRSAPFAAQCEA
ncbi:MAG: MBL fold metallo-hydrolase, partial [Acidovorax sp.]